MGRIDTKVISASASSKRQPRARAKKQLRTFIGVLASNDDRRPNLSLIALFNYVHAHTALRERAEKFHFVMTGGTWDRIVYGNRDLVLSPLKVGVVEWLRPLTTILPSASDGGVILLSYLISQQQCSIVWPFFAPTASHWLRPENLALLRLADQWRAKRLMNRGSVMAWLDNEAEADCHRNLQDCPPKLLLTLAGARPIAFQERPAREPFDEGTTLPKWTRRHKSFSQMTIALIAHDDMKPRMIEFAIDHEAELTKFRMILATGTTGREVMAAMSDRIHKKVKRFHSGPKGGDIEIATAILYNRCDVVIFFIDPLHPHPHIEDIRVVFQACMIRDQVVMITNEVHAREFMSRVVRERDGLDLYV